MGESKGKKFACLRRAAKWCVAWRAKRKRALTRKVRDQIQHHDGTSRRTNNSPTHLSQWVTLLVSARERAMREYTVSDMACDGTDGVQLLKGLQEEGNGKTPPTTQ